MPSAAASEDRALERRVAAALQAEAERQLFDALPQAPATLWNLETPAGRRLFVIRTDIS